MDRELFSGLYIELIETDKQVKRYHAKIEKICKNSEVCQRLIKVPGIGLMSARLASGGKQKLLGISKRRDVYIRKLLIHGARSVIRRL
jgi:transposase